jgi:hypothetical protein
MLNQCWMMSSQSLAGARSSFPVSPVRASSIPLIRISGSARFRTAMAIVSSVVSRRRAVLRMAANILSPACVADPSSGPPRSAALDDCHQAARHNSHRTLLSTVRSLFRVGFSNARHVKRPSTCRGIFGGELRPVRTGVWLPKASGSALLAQERSRRRLASGTSTVLRSVRSTL